MIAFLLFIAFFIFTIICTVRYFKLKKQYAITKKVVDSIEDVDAYVARKTEEADTCIKNAEAEAKILEEKRDALNKEREALTKELKELELEVFVGSVRVEGYENLKSDEVKNNISLLHNRQEEMEKQDNAIITSNLISNTKKIANSQKKQILRCFNIECKSIIENVTVKNVDSSRSKIQRAFDSINKMFEVDGVKITQEFLATKFEELSLMYAYRVKLEEEAEQRKAIREQMVEEEKLRREIEREKQKIEKEESQFNNEVNKLMAYMQASKDDIERQLYVDKIKELETKLALLAKDKENVLQREQNTRAGFVYIISNIGSFGENVYKIGMTRRLEPMERIAELSSASVPFAFDVHALIFSDDAPGLETVLHQYFDNKRVNKINPRKEFFKVELQEIKDVVTKNHNATVKFVDIPEATEYRETVKMEKA